MVGILSQLPLTASGSALLGSGGALSVLGVDGGDSTAALFGNLGSTTNSLMQQIKATAETRLEDIQTQINDVAKQRNDAINVQNDRWISVKAQVNNAEIAVTNGQDSITKVGNILLDMRTTIANAGDPQEDIAIWRDQFDSQVNSINIEADNGGPASNLVGNINPVDFTPNQIEYRNDLGAGSTTLTGTNIATSFRIDGDDGTVWVPDLSSDTLTAYSGLQGEPQTYKLSTGASIDKTTSTRNGLTLVSYDAKTGKIVVKVNIVAEDPPITVTGTLKRAGISIMQSWFYNGLTTDADRKRARTDINASEVDLVSAGATLQTAATQTGMDQRHINAALDDLSKQTAKVNSDQQTQIQDSQVKAAQQFQAMQANLQNLSSQQSNYLQAFAGFIDDPFAQAQLDLIA